MENNSTNPSKKSEFEKAFLEHNIWPSIHRCVKNRYLIIGAAVTAFSYVMQSGISRKVETSLIAVIGLTLFTVLNHWNYCSNADEQAAQLEKQSVTIKGKKTNINLFFTITILFLLWSGFFIFILPGSKT